MEDLYGAGSVDYAKAEPYSCPSTSVLAPQSASANRLRGRLIATEPKAYFPVAGRPRIAPLQTSVDPTAP